MYWQKGVLLISGGTFDIFFHNIAYEFQSLTFTTVAGTTQVHVYIWKDIDGGEYAFIDNISLTGPWFSPINRLPGIHGDNTIKAI